MQLVVGHGQMPAEELEQVMVDFVDGKADVLLCTTIIESGLDIPRANTMFVNRADTLRPGAALPAARAHRPRRASAPTATC